MKKILIVGIVLLMLIPVVGAIDKTNNETLSNSVNEEFTHIPFIEYCSRSTCEPCVDASSQLYSIYNSGDLNFNYVTLVSDKGNAQIEERLTDLEVVAVPIVFFDGKFKKSIGSKPDEGPYRTNIALAGEREVPDIEIDVNVLWQGGGKLKLTVVVYNNELENYSGQLRTYILEVESRWYDQSGSPYHYTAIDIPIDSELALSSSHSKPAESTHTFNKNWDGSIYGFDDIIKENILVVAAVFDGDTDFAVESASSGIPSGDTNTHQKSDQLLLKTVTQKLIDRFPMLSKLLSFYNN